MPDEVYALSQSTVLLEEVGADCDDGNQFFLERACNFTYCGMENRGDLEPPTA